MKGSEKIEKLFKTALYQLSQSAHFAHPIVQISLSASEECVFHSSLIFVLKLPQSASPKMNNISLARRKLHPRLS